MLELNKIVRVYLLVLFFVLLINIEIVQAKTLEVSLIIKGLEPEIEVENYYGYLIYYNIFKDYSVILKESSLQDYKLNNNFENGNFKIKLFSVDGYEIYEKSFEPVFIILSNPPIEVNETSVFLNLPYSDNVKYLKVYYKNEEKLSTDISFLLCNNDGVCEGNENYLSCPSDCNWYANDSLCIGVADISNSTLDYWEDHYCDYDCYNDNDCNNQNNCNNNPSQDICQQVFYCNFDGICEINEVFHQNFQGYDCPDCTGGKENDGICNNISEFSNLNTNDCFGLRCGDNICNSDNNEEDYFSCYKDCERGPDSNKDGKIDNKELLIFIFKSIDDNEKEKAVDWWLD